MLMIHPDLPALRLKPNASLPGSSFIHFLSVTLHVLTVSWKNNKKMLYLYNKSWINKQHELKDVLWMSDWRCTTTNQTFIALKGEKNTNILLKWTQKSGFKSAKTESSRVQSVFLGATFSTALGICWGFLLPVSGHSVETGNSPGSAEEKQRKQVK